MITFRIPILSVGTILQHAQQWIVICRDPNHQHKEDSQEVRFPP